MQYPIPLSLDYMYKNVACMCCTYIGYNANVLTTELKSSSGQTISTVQSLPVPFNFPQSSQLQILWVYMHVQVWLRKGVVPPVLLIMT